MITKTNKVKAVNKNKQAIINFRTKESIKKDSSRILDKMGLDMSTALNLFLYNVVIRKALPMNLITENGYTREFEREILEASKDILPKKYNSVKELMKDLELEED